MFTRSTIAFVCLLLCLAACGDSALPADDNGGAGTVAAGTLSVNGRSSIVVAPRGSAEIRVIYRTDDFDGDGEGDPVAGVAVEFALVGDAAAVSLSPARAVTDASGEALARLTAGSDSARFRVRASAQTAEPVYVDVKVEKSATRTAEISAGYDGLRNLATRTVTALPGLGCDAANDLLATGMKGELTQSYEDPEGSVLLELGPGLRYAMLAWGSDPRGGILAVGCSEIDVPVDADLALTSEGERVVVDLQDRALALAGSYEVTLELDVARSAQRAGETAIAGGQTLLGTGSAAGAEYLLAAIEAGMRGAGKDAAADAVLSARDTLGVSLHAELDAVNAGPQPWLARLGAEMQDRGARLVLQAAYGVSSIAGVPMSITLTGMQSRSADGLRSLSYPAMLPTLQIDAQYDDARAVIAVDTIQIQLPLGSYADHLLDAIDAAEPEGLLGLLASESGCAQLVTWAESQPKIADACAADCVSAACDAATGVLLSNARMKLSTLDADHPSIGVRGELLVSDTDNDSIVDELGTAAFVGSWGKAPKAAQPDLVDADFSVITNIPAL